MMRTPPIILGEFLAPGRAPEFLVVEVAQVRLLRHEAHGVAVWRQRAHSLKRFLAGEYCSHMLVDHVSIFGVCLCERGSSSVTGLQFVKYLSSGSVRNE